MESANSADLFGPADVAFVNIDLQRLRSVICITDDTAGILSAFNVTLVDII